MKNAGLIAALVVVSLVCLALSAAAEVATEREALNMATNWVARIVAKTGGWGKAASARVTGIQPLKHKGRMLGYYCPVEPDGYLVVSLHKELAPVKAYSETGQLDPVSDEGPGKIIKAGLQRMIDSVEKRIGKPLESAKAKDLADVLETNYRPVWDQLALEPTEFEKLLAAGGTLSNYQEGGVMLWFQWGENPPYNAWCPWLFYCDTSNGRARVGSSAVAAGQIMRYWCWPPCGITMPYSDEYDWVNMPDELWYGSSQTKIDAVAELLYEFGSAAGTNYLDCYPRACVTSLVRDAYPFYFRYSNAANVAHRDDHSEEGWFGMIKAQLNLNRPIHYAMHSREYLDKDVVLDGWRESGDPVVREYHMNYGVPEGSVTGWYVIDTQPKGTMVDDMIEDIVPDVALGATLSGTYPKESFNYRYFDQDASCSVNTIFAPGQRLQFLPNVTASSQSGTLRFEGTPTEMTTLFARGDLNTGARIIDGVIKLRPEGTVVLR